ncbi:ImuA family protein [Mesorhizobium sp. KR9-304]|uniref:ImuA family protein n=1 Tax=Mesorhizobium sp. KR9-304 TaxID=3156614 RepID=UPI0032B3590D
MAMSSNRFALSELRERVACLEGGSARRRDVLSFGVPAIDRVLPGGGLALGALHEVAGGGNGAVDGAAAALFAAGIAARTVGKVLWCVTRPDLFAPAIEQAGLPPGRVIYVEAGDEKAVLACFEEGLRGGFGAVVSEIARLSMTASRRLQLAAESSGAIGIAIRRWRRQTEATDFGQPTAAETRWRVSVLPSTPLPVQGVGRARWQLELIRCRAGESADFTVEACDAKGRIALPSVVVDRPLQKEIGRRRASA